MNLDEIWDEKIKDIIGNDDYNHFLKTLRKISEEII